MIVYYVDNSIHHIPAFVDIARKLGGTVLTDGPDSHATMTRLYPDVPCEFFATLAELRARLTELRPEAIVQPDYTRPLLAVDFKTAHIQVFHGTSDKSHGVSQRARDYDFLLVSGERKRARMEAAGLLHPGNHAVVGYPKVDRVFRGEISREDCAERLGIDPSRPTVLYAPTWRDNKRNSSLFKFGASILARLPEAYNLIVKLHPNTKRYDRKYYSLFKRFADENPRIKLIDFEHDVIPVMGAADLLLADVSSVSHEFLAFDRPFVFLDPRLIPLGGRDKTWMWRCGAVVRRPSQVWPVVARELRDPGRFAAQRRQALEEVFFTPDGRAAERAAEAIRAFLDRMPDNGTVSSV